MIPSVLKKPGLLFLSLAAMLFVVIASSAPAHAATLVEDSEKFLRYRAIAGCLAKNDLENTSPTKVINGEWFKAGALSTNNTKLSAALLTGGDSNDTHCKDDDADKFLVSSASPLGFSDTGAMWCSIQTNANRDKEAASGGNAFTRCTGGSGDYDVSDDDGPEQAAQFTEGIKAYATGGAAFPFEASGAMRYYIYYETFMAYCEPSREKDYIESTDSAKAESKDYVVINEVILDDAGKYKIVPALYKVSQDDKQDHNVEGVWSLPNGNPYSQKCYELAAKTWDFDDAYGLYIQAHPDEAVTPGGGSGRGIDDPVCSAGALGWVICPLTEGLVDIIQQVAEILQGLLVYQPLIGSDQGKSIKAIWNLILVIANLGLVIAILIIVFSQATSVGLSNYGIKKLLPRVFAAAILMNLSFYICAVAVDLSNILGVSVKAIVEAGMNQLSEINNAGNSDVRYGAGFGQNVTVSLAGLMIAAVAIGTGAIWLLLPMLVTAVVAIITALLILAARQVLITLLIIISPLAILAWILPNTDEWFTKWRKLFTILLLLFPLIMAIFYGSILVSAVILSAGTSTGSGLNDFTIKLLAFMVLIVPLFSLPFIMKAAGGILDRFGVLVNNRNKGLIDRSRKKSTEMQDRTSYQRGKAIRKRTADEYRGTKFANKLGKGGRTGILARGVGGNLGRAKGLENTVFGEQSSRLGSYAVAAERKAASERRQSIAAGLRSEGVDMKELKGRYLTSVENGDVDSANAQLTHLATTFGAGGRQLAAEALDETRLSKITDVGKRAKMRTELNETIGGELYGSLITSRADIAKGGFRTQEDANGNTIAGSDNSFGFTDISKLTAPQIASQDKGVHEMGRVRGQAFDKSEAYIAATNGELISKITDTETRKEIARRSGVPLETSPANGQANSDPDANSQSGDPMETYVREQQAKNQQNNPNDTP